jgi:hypothetical protein
MPSAEYDLRFLRAGTELLEDYLKSSEVYWPVGVQSPAGDPPYPQLTLSALLLARIRARARVATPAGRAELAQLEEQIDTLRTRWRVAWEKKAAADFHARLVLWRNYLEDYRENPEANVDRYAYEVTRRVQLQLLEREAEAVPEAEFTLLEGLDHLLKAVFLPGEFIGEPDLASSFPADPYWYLYGKPKKSL